jgi:hypothetical protein
VTGSFTNPWRAADDADARSGEGRRDETWQVALDAGYELIEFPEPDAGEGSGETAAAARRASLCFAQQMLFADARKSPRTRRMILERILLEAGA